MRIVHLINSLSSGGAEVFVTDLCAALAATNDVSVVTYAGILDEKGKQLAQHLETHGVRYVSVANFGSLGKFSVPIQLARILATLRPHVVHAHLERSEQFLYLAHFVSRHNFYAFRTKHDERPYRWPNRSRSFRRFYNATVACSGATEKTLVRQFGNATVIKVENGVDTLRLSCGDSVRRRTGLDDKKGRLQVGLVGRMESIDGVFIKGQDIAIEAFCSHGIGEIADLHLIGDGVHRNELVTLARSCGEGTPVAFRGIVPQICTVFKELDLIVMPSRSEGLPIVAIEAVSFGLPLLVSDIAAFERFRTESVKRFVTGSVESFAECIRSVAFEIDRMKEAALQSIDGYRREFGIERVAAEYEKVYRRFARS